jgi:sec-independent protein translocase protein TatC
MPFLDHLEELRWRLFRCAAALAITIIGSFAVLYTKKFDVINLLVKPVEPYMTGSLIATHPSELFGITMDIAIALGVVLASPVLAWQIWAFLSPALYKHEKKVVIPVLIGAAVLFLAGMALAYFFVLPVTLQFLLGFQSESVQSMLQVGAYMGFVISMCVAFGAAFELPIVILLLSALGIVNSRMLKRFRRHAFVGCLIAAALITPGSDITALAALTVSLYLLYELSIGLSALVTRRREKKIAAEAVVGGA